jgi:predicted alpha/beta-fold hydrolase
VDALFGLERDRRAYLADGDDGPIYSGHVSTALPGALRKPEPTVLHREVVAAHDGVHVAMDWGRGSWYFDAAVPQMAAATSTASPVFPKSGKWFHEVFPCNTYCDADRAPAGLALRHGPGAKFYASFQLSSLPVPKAVVVLCPGLTSTCESFYLASIQRILLQNGYDPVLINSRGLGVRIQKPAKQMSAAFTDDLRYIVRSYLSPDALRRRYHGENAPDDAPVPRLFAIGFSVGGNVLTKALAEDGATLLAAEAAGDAAEALKTTCHQYITAALAISSPWDIAQATFTLARGINYFLYEGIVSGGAKDYVCGNPALYLPNDHDDGVDASLPARPAACEELVNSRTPQQHVTLRDLDEFAIAPHHGYHSAGAYYADAEAFRRLHTLRTPLLALSATEDPIVGPARPDAQWERAVNGIKWPFGTAPADDVRPTTWAEHDALLKKRAAAMQPAPVEQRPPIAYMRVPTGGHIGFLGTPLQEWRGEPNMSERIILRALSNALEA